LDEARKTRNKIHEDFAEFSEQDLSMFEVASILAAQFYYSSVPVTPEEISSSMKSTAEMFAKEWLTKFGFFASDTKA
jgi:hypothetical protein